jgi:simple sugar transport system permease protein
MAKKEIKSVNTGFSSIEALPIIIVYVVLIGAFMITAPGTFLKYRIYQAFLSTIPPPLILALGLTLIVTAGEIDLSFPAIITFSGFVYASLFTKMGMTWIPFIAAIASGILVGFVNGILVAKIGMPSIIATLGAQFFWSGLTVILSGGLAWNIRAIREEFMHKLFTSRLGNFLPAQALWALAVGVVLWFILNRHRFGEHILFIGDNMSVAQVMGVNVPRTKIKLFTLMGGLSAFAAVLLTLEMSTYWTTQGSGYLLIVMASVFIGGTSIFGGEGTIIGTVFGSFIVGSIEAGIVASGLGGFWTRLVVGLVLIVAVTLNIVITKSGGAEATMPMRKSVFLKGLKKEVQKSE